MPKFAQGKYNVKNPKKYMGNKLPLYRSSWEFAFMRFCDENPNVTEWASEPLRIPYKHPLTNKKTTYVPDFLLRYKDSSGQSKVELIEIKPKNQTLKESAKRSQRNATQWVINQAKWQAASAWCAQNGIVFRIINEDDIFHQGKRRK
jgi:hypothetical protein